MQKQCRGLLISANSPDATATNLAGRCGLEVAKCETGARRVRLGEHDGDEMCVKARERSDVDDHDQVASRTGAQKPAVERGRLSANYERVDCRKPLNTQV